MRMTCFSVVGFAWLVLGAVLPQGVHAQAVGFAPGVGSFPDGVSLNAIPAVTADRRYVRLGIDANFSTVSGFTNFPVPAAVGGGGFGGGGGGGGNRSGGGAGPAPGGFASVMANAGDWDDSGIPYRPGALALRPLKPLQATPSRSKKPLADPVIVPIAQQKPPAALAPAAKQKPRR